MEIDPSVYNHLAVGLSEVISYSYNVTDGNGGSIPQSATITIIGINDHPTINSPVTATATENDSTFVVDLLTGAGDPDNGDVIDVDGLTLTHGDDSGVTIAANTLLIDPAAYNHLAAGESEMIAYSYNVSDNHGGSVPQTAIITIAGINDQPTVGNPINASATEDDMTFTVDLLSGAHDPDTNDTLAVDGLNLIDGDDGGVSVLGNSLEIDPLAYNRLAAGESEMITYAFNVIDGNGGSVPQSATITIVGVNDQPTVMGPITATATEDDSTFTVDLLSGANDPDESDTLAVSGLFLVGGDDVGVSVLGNLMEIDPSAYVHLTTGESEVITYAYHVIDSHSGSIPQMGIITITGTEYATTYVSNSWHFLSDEDNDGLLSRGDRITNDNDVYLPGTVVARYGIFGFGAITTGAIAGSLTEYDAVNEAMNGVAPGGTTLVLAGIYTENITIDKDVTLSGFAATSGDVVIDPISGDGITITASATNVAVTDLRVTNAVNGVSAAGVSGSLTFENIEATDNTHHGFDLTNVAIVTTSNVTVTGNKTGVAANGVVSFTDRDGNYSHNKDHGIQLTDIVGNVTLTQTTFHDNNADGDEIGDGLVAVDGADTNPLAIGGDLIVRGVTIARSGRKWHLPATWSIGQRYRWIGNLRGGFRPARDHSGQSHRWRAHSGEPPWSVSVSHVDVSHNGGVGFLVDAVTAGVIMSNVSAHGNGLEGIQFQQSVNGAASLFGVTADANGGTGIDFASPITGDVNFLYVYAAANGSAGIRFSDQVDGEILFTTVSVSDNLGAGIAFENGQNAGVIGNVSFGQVIATGNGGAGIYFTGVSGDLNFTDVIAEANLVGVDVGAAGAASFADTAGIYSRNEDHGIRLTDILGNVTLTQTTFQDNNADGDGIGDGLMAVDGADSDPLAIGGDLIVRGVTIGDLDGNGTYQRHGLLVNGIGGSATFEGELGQPASFRDNFINGVRIQGSLGGTVNLSHVDVSHNGGIGFLVDAITVGVNISNVSAHGNGLEGIEFLASIAGPVTFSNVRTINNVEAGIDFEGTITGAVTFLDVISADNGYWGIQFSDEIFGDVQLTDVTIEDNALEGIEFYEQVTGNVAFDRVLVTGNAAGTQAAHAGIDFTADVNGDIFFENVTAIGNLRGLRVRKAHSFSDNDGFYSSNLDDGIQLNEISGSVMLTGTTLEDNNGNNDLIGAGLQINSSNSQGVGGDLILQDVTIRDTDGSGTSRQQRTGVSVDGVGGSIQFVTAATVSGHELSGCAYSGGN